MKRAALLISFLLTLAGIPSPAGSPPDASAAEAAVAVEGTTATYAGKLNEESVRRFLEAVEGRGIDTLVVTSGGGDIDAGMTLGTWVFENRVAVAVEFACMSSCANYVFTAAPARTIREGSLVAWHGSILQREGMSDEDVRAAALEAWESLPPEQKEALDPEAMAGASVRQMRAYREAGKQRQAEFFERIGIDERICRVGTEACAAEDFFALSVSDMARFGVGNVTAPEAYEETDLAPFLARGKSVEFVRVPADYLETRTPEGPPARGQ